MKGQGDSSRHKAKKDPQGIGGLDAKPRRPGPAGARAAAAEAVLAVKRGTSLDAALEKFSSGIDAEQRSLTAELAYGTCRWFIRLDGILRRLLERPIRSSDQVLAPLICVGLYQLLHTRIPPHAAVAETVAAARILGKSKATGLINGVLRRFQRESESLLRAVDRETDKRLAYPHWFLDSLKQAWPDCWEAVAVAGNQRPPMTLRVNLARVTRGDLATRFSEAGITSRPIRAPESALMLDKPVPVERIPGFRDGLVSVQDAAAQQAALLLDVQPGHRVLDACAAPGGKTAHIAERQTGLSELVALDRDAARLARVTENLERLGLSARVLSGDATRPEESLSRFAPFDRILLDAPCSATGVIRRHPDIKLLRRQSDLSLLVEKQRRMLDALWPLLVPGGMLLYCTCSVLPEENAMQISQFLLNQPHAAVRPIRLLWGRKSGDGWQVLPSDGNTDGFFYALLEKLPS